MNEYAETADIWLGKDNVGPHGVEGCSYICENCACRLYIKLMWLLWEWDYGPLSWGDVREIDPQSSIPAGVS